MQYIGAGVMSPIRLNTVRLPLKERSVNCPFPACQIRFITYTLSTRFKNKRFTSDKPRCGSLKVSWLIWS